MSDLDIKFYFALFLRRLPLFFTCLAACALAAVLVALSIKPVYQATAKILLELPEISAELARSTVPTGAIEQLEIIQQQIMTRDNILDLARRLDVYPKDIASPEETDVVEDMRARTSFEQVDLGSGSAQGAVIFEVSFDAPDPALAARVTNEIVDMLLSRNAKLRTDRAGNTLYFFDREVERLGGELKGVEDKILKFKTEHATALPEGSEFRRSQQTTQQERLLLLDREEGTLRSRRNSVIQTYETFGNLGDSQSSSPDDRMLQDLNRALSEQLSLFSEDSEKVKALRARIAMLQEKVRAQGKTARGELVARGSPELSIRLAEIDERLKSIEDEKIVLNRSLGALSEAIAATPANEAALASLERSRTNIQSQYDIAIARRAQAWTGEQIERTSKGERFSLVEAAVAPNSPIKPKRSRIVAGGIAAGLALGAGLIFLLELLNRTIRRPADVAAIFDYEPLATIPYIRSTAAPAMVAPKAIAALAICVLIALLVMAQGLQGRLDGAWQAVVSTLKPGGT